MHWDIYTTGAKSLLLLVSAFLVCHQQGVRESKCRPCCVISWGQCRVVNVFQLCRLIMLMKVLCFVCSFKSGKLKTNLIVILAL